MQNTKIVATIGPASADEDTLENLIETGVDVARLNMSHNTREWHGDIIERIRSLSADIGVLADTQGPEVRLGTIPDNQTLDDGSTVHLIEADETSENDVLPVAFDNFLEQVEDGDTIVIADGSVTLHVDQVEDGQAVCTVRSGGFIRSKKSVTVIGKDLGLQAPTEKDVEDIQYAVNHGADMAALSFVKTVDNIQDIRTAVDDDLHIVSKIEHRTAVENMDAIIAASDGVMVARGDLGVQCPAARVPILQKQIIRKCNEAGKPVVVATEMLTSMLDNPSATRAEVSDIANAVLDGADAVMLSDETAVGNHPIAAVDVMRNVIREVEEAYTPSGKKTHEATHGTDAKAVTEEICHSVKQVADDMPIKYIVAHTTSGHTAEHIAKYRPNAPIIAFTDSNTVKHRLHLVWGVQPRHITFPDHVDEMLVQSAQHIYAHEDASRDDLLVLTAGVPTGTSGTTNMMEIRTVGDLLDEAEQ